MDLVRIFHLVDMPSSGKHDFNYTHVVGLIQSILIQFILISLWCLSNVHVLLGLLSHEWLASLIVFLLCVFLGSKVLSCIQQICVPPMWSSIWFSMDDHGVD